MHTKSNFYSEEQKKGFQHTLEIKSNGDLVDDSFWLSLDFRKIFGLRVHRVISLGVHIFKQV